MGDRFLWIALVFACIVMGAAVYLLFHADEMDRNSHRVAYARDMDTREATSSARPRDLSRERPRRSSQRTPLKASVGKSTGPLVPIQGPPDFMAEQGIGTTGRVVDELGRGLSGVEIMVSRGAASALSISSQVSQGYSAADGRFEIRGLRAYTTYSLRFRHPEYVSPKPYSVEIGRSFHELSEIVLVLGGVLRGSVKDPFGNAVAGAKVVAVLERDASHSDFDSLVRMIGHGSRMARTEADGGFRLEGLHRGHYRVRAQALVFGESKEVRCECVGEEAGDDVALTFQAGARFWGTVVDSQGLPVEGAQVELHDRGDAQAPILQTQSDQKGEFSFDSVGSGRVDLLATSDDFATTRRVLVLPHSEPPLIRLRDYGLLRGAVFDAKLQVPLGDFEVALERPGQRGDWIPIIPESLVYGRGAEHHQFRVLADPGEYRLRIRASGYVQDHVERLIIEPGESLEVKELHLDRECVLVGRVLDQRQQPVPGAKLWVRKTRSHSSSRQAGHRLLPKRLIEIGNDGRFLVQGLSSGLYDVEVMADDFAPQSLYDFEVSRMTARTPLEFLLNRGGRLIGRVIDGRGQPKAKAEVQAFGPGERGRPYRTWADADGDYGFDGLPAGVYSVSEVNQAKTVSIPGIGMSLGPGRTKSVQAEVLEGEVAEADLGHDGFGTLSGWVYDRNGPREGVKVFLGADSSWIQSGEIYVLSDEEGRFIFDDLTPGTYQCRASFGTGSGVVQRVEVGASPVDVVLHVSSTSVQGRTTLGGLPVSGVEVRLEPIGESDGERFSRSLPTNGPVTDSQGEFTTISVPPGRYEVIVTHPELILAAPQEAFVEDIGGTLFLELPLALGGTLRGSVSDQSYGATCAGVRVRLVREGKVIAESLTDGSGRFEMRSLRDGHYRLECLGGMRYVSDLREVEIYRGVVQYVDFSLRLREDQ